MKKLMVTVALVVGLMSTSVSFANEVNTSSALAVSDDFVAFQGIQAKTASDEEVQQVSGEIAPIIALGLLWGGRIVAGAVMGAAAQVGANYVNCSSWRCNDTQLVSSNTPVSTFPLIVTPVSTKIGLGAVPLTALANTTALSQPHFVK